MLISSQCFYVEVDSAAKKRALALRGFDRVATLPQWWAGADVEVWCR